MRLLIVRHAKAFERDAARWPDDSHRPLTSEGRKAFRRMARRLGRFMEPPDLVLASSWDRAWATAEELECEAGWPAPVREALLEDADESHAVPGLLERVRAERGAEAIAFVGHEPFLSRFASTLLCGRGDGVSIAMRKGAIMELEVDPEGPVGATLSLLVQPGAFRGARKKV